MINPNIVLQASSGRPQEVYKPENDMGGYLALARVTQIHHKYNTADVEIVRTKGILKSTSNNEGRFGARIVVSTAHYNPNTLTSSGVVEPYQVGQLVVLAFLDGYKNQPIILGSFHDTWDTSHSILTEKYPLTDANGIADKREALKYLRVFPSQLYTRVDGIGGVEVSHPSKSFIKVDPINPYVSDTHGLFDHDKLEEKNSATSESIKGHTEETMLPVKLLAVHRSSVSDADTTWTKVFVDSTGLLRFTRDNNDSTLTYVELSENGSYVIRRQKDINIHDAGQDYTQIRVNDDGSLLIERKINDASSSISLDVDGNIDIQKQNSAIRIRDNAITIGHSSGSFIRFEENGDIVIKSKGLLRVNEREVI